MVKELQDKSGNSASNDHNYARGDTDIMYYILYLHVILSYGTSPSIIYGHSEVLSSLTSVAVLATRYSYSLRTPLLGIYCPK